jgi:hypothetical protein
MNTTLITTCDPGESFAHSSVQSRSFPETAISGYFKWLPAIWLLGLMLPLAFVVIFASFLLYVRSRRGILFALPWFAVGSAQYLSVVINWLGSRESAAVLLKHLLASYVSGWFLLGAAIGIGASGIIEPQRLLRSIARVSYYSILLAIPAYVLAFCLRGNSLFLISPIGHFIPVTFASRNFAFGIFVYNWEDLGGMLLPRLSLMSPWPTAMGTAGVCTVFIAVNLKSKWERGWCTAGGVLMVISSMGRLSMLTLVICLVLRWLLNWRRPYQVCFAYAMLLIVFIGLLVQSPDILVHSFVDRFNKARPGASEVRDEVYEANWKGFSEAPLFGHGWPGRTILDDDPVYGEGAGMMVVGSHSTVSGLLYKGGLLTFSLFVFAFMFTTWGLLTRRDTTPLKDNLMIILAIGFSCLGEGLESLVLPLLFAFLWIGTSLSTRAPDEYRVVQ